jgi:sec-independent protein translocase protein TatA
VIPTVPVLAGFLPGGGELWVILLLALLFFGASRLPGIARSLGRSVNEFKQGMKDEPDGKSSAATPTEGNASKN